MPLTNNISVPIVAEAPEAAADWSAQAVENWATYKDSINYELLLRSAPDQESVFGAGSVVNPDLLSSHEIPSEILSYPHLLSWQYAFFLLSVLFLYFIMIYRYRSSFKTLFQCAFSMKRALETAENMSKDIASLTHYGVLLLALTSSAFLTDMMVRNMYIWQGITYIVIGIALGVLLVVIAYRAVMIAAIRAMDSDDGFYKKLYFINRISGTVIALIVTPLVIITGLGGYSMKVAAASLIILAFYHFFRILKYFILRGFSIFQWFLYLCTVEIFPISFIIAFVAKSNSIT